MVALHEAEVRVLGVMIEKSLTQPGAYPMTINAILMGSNQLQNREPVVEYTEAQVATALGDLIRKQLAVQAPPEPGARANRFAHRTVEMFHWDRREQAIMAELLLRGRQTAGELRSRASRMTPFADVSAVMNTLAELQRREPRFVEELSREPGRSTTRFRHLLSSAPSGQSGGAVTHERQPPGPEEQSAIDASHVESLQTVAGTSSNVDLASRVEEVERRLDIIERELQKIRTLIE